MSVFSKTLSERPSFGQSERLKCPDFPIPETRISPTVTGVKGLSWHPQTGHRAWRKRRSHQVSSIFRQESRGVRVFCSGPSPAHLWNPSARHSRPGVPDCFSLQSSRQSLQVLWKLPGKSGDKFSYSGILTPHIAQCRHVAGAYRSGSGESHPQNRSSAEP
jgi:hypothetical protein